MAHQITAPRIIIAALGLAGTMAVAGPASAQSHLTSRRADVNVQRQCTEAVQHRLPGSDTSTNLEYNKNALYFACMQNGGTIPGAN